MKLLPLDVCRIIWTLCGNDAIFLNKELITFIAKLKAKMLNPDTNKQRILFISYLSIFRNTLI